MEHKPDPAREDRAVRLERQLSAAQKITHIGSWEWDVPTNEVTWSDELYRIYGLQPQSRNITLEVFMSFVHPGDRERVQHEVTRAVASGSPFAYSERIVRADGAVRHLDTSGEVSCDAGGRTTRLIGTCRDVTEERERDETEARAQALKAAEQRVLEMIARGDPLGSVLNALIEAIEEQAPGMLGSVLLIEDGVLRHAAAPHLPDAYMSAIDGQPIGPRAGSCGTAAFRAEPVHVIDIQADPLWTDWRELARAHGLRACWSTPIFAGDGRVAATFALYYGAPRGPTAEDLQLIDRATHLARIAIERNQLVDQLRALSAHIDSVREDERKQIAREIHDELGQALTALKIDLAWLDRHAANVDSARERIADMSRMTDELIGRVRRISAALRPGVLDDLGLLAAIEWQAQEFERRTGTRCVVRSNMEDLRLDPQVSTAIFRVFQEALTNVLLHARAGGVEVRLDYRSRSVLLEVCDDGVGIAPEAEHHPASLGLLGMRERILRLGGTVALSPRSGGGTTVTVEIPLQGGP